MIFSNKNPWLCLLHGRDDLGAHFHGSTLQPSSLWAVEVCAWEEFVLLEELAFWLQLCISVRHRELLFYIFWLDSGCGSTIHNTDLLQTVVWSLSLQSRYWLEFPKGLAPAAAGTRFLDLCSHVTTYINVNIFPGALHVEHCMDWHYETGSWTLSPVKRGLCYLLFVLLFFIWDLKSLPVFSVTRDNKELCTT